MVVIIGVSLLDLDRSHVVDAAAGDDGANAAALP